MSGTSSESETLFELLHSCKMGAAGAIVGGHIDSNQLRQELYIPTDEDDFVESFFVDKYEQDGQLLVITGSAGDGKSALLSKSFRRAQQEGIASLTEADIHMDATASTGKMETYDETLTRFFDRVQDRLHSETGARTGIAINLGLAIDFFDRRGFSEKYPAIWAAIKSAKTRRTYHDDPIHVLNLTHRDLYDTHPERLGDGLLRELVDKFDGSDPASPFYDAYGTEKKECPAGSNCPLQYNMEQFTDPAVRDRVTELLAAKSVIDTVYLNPRRMLDHIASMLLPPELEETNASDPVCSIGKSVNYGKSIDAKSLLWNAVFREVDGTSDSGTGLLDPTAQGAMSVDLDVLKWGSNRNELAEHLSGAPHLETSPIDTRIRTALRKLYLAGERDDLETALEWSWFPEFLGAYTFLDTPEDEVQRVSELKDNAQTLNRTLNKALKGWSGDVVDGDYIEFIDGIKTPDYRFLAKWTSPDVNRSASHQRTREEATPGKLWFVLDPEGSEVMVPVPVTFELYILMKRIGRGYSPNSRDLERSEGMRLIHSRLSEFTKKREAVRIHDNAGSELFRIETGAFDGVTISGGDTS